MSISVQGRSLSQLKKECQQLNIDVKQTGKREGKTDYIKSLRSYYLEQKYHGNIPKSLDLMLQMESPMLCQRYNVLKPEEQQEIWDSKEWYLEEKEDGNRMVYMFVDGQFDFYSRNISVTDYLPISYKDNVYMDMVDKSKIKDSFILDSEVISTNPHISTIMGSKGVVTETQLQAVSSLLALNPEQSIEIQKKECPLQFKTFDCVWFNGEWIKDLPLIKRRKYLIRVIKQLKEAGMNVKMPMSNISNKRAFHEMILKSGGEGTVAKRLMSPYIASNARRRDGFVKIKRSMSTSLQLSGLADTVDAWVSGYEPADDNKSWKGLIGAVEFSVMLRCKDGSEKPHMIARVTNIPMELRKKMTDHDENGNPILKKEYYSRVGEVDGQCISARNKRLRNAVLVRWRNDRSADTCYLDEDFMESMIL